MKFSLLNSNKTDLRYKYHDFKNRLMVQLVLGGDQNSNLSKLDIIRILIMYLKKL